MAKNNNNEYIVSIKADIKNLKKDIKSELQGVLREVDSVGDAVANGITPDTKEFETKLASLEAKMEKLANSTKDVEQQVASMKTAFKGFTELEASMKVIGEQNKEMYNTFVKMTPYLHEFAKTFTAMKPEQAGVAFAKAFQGAQQAADVTKKIYHDIETDSKHGANIVNGAAEVMGHSVNEARKELEKLIELRKTYNKEDYSGISKQESLRKEVESHRKLYDELQSSLSDLTEEDLNYNQVLASTIEAGQKLLALWDKLDNANPRSKDLKDKTYFGDVEEDIKYFLKEYESAISSIPAQVSKVELKPLKLKVDISDDGKLLEQVNKQIDKISKDPGLHKIEIETLFVDPVDKADVDVDDQSITSDKAYQQIEKSLKKQIKRINTAFDNETKTLTDKISEFKKNINESLKLKFEWQKGNNASEIQTLFDLVQQISLENKIILHPDTDDFIKKIDDALNAHEFSLKLDSNDVALNAKIVGGVPITGVSGGGPLIRGKSNKPNQPIVPQQPPRAPDASPASAEEKRQTKVVDNNSEAVIDNTAAIKDVVAAFKSWASGINRSLGSGDQKKINNAMAKKHAMKGIVGFDPTEVNEKQLAEKVADLLQNTTMAESLKNARTNIPELKSRGINLVTDKFLERFVGAQDYLGVQRSTHQAESIKHSHKEYYEFAEMIARMGGSLKKSFVNEGVIPGANSLEQVGELFDGTAYTNLAKSAYEYADAVKKVSNEFADGGNLYDFMKSLDERRNTAQGVLDSSNATKKERNDATKTINEVSSIKTQIIDQLRPFGERYEAERKQVAGLIASISKGFKFTLTLKGEDGKEDYKLSFNDKTAEADYHVQYYGEMLGRMNKIDWDNDVVASEFSSTINNTPLHLMYDNVMGKKDAVSAVVSQYNALDDKTKAFVNTFITDINTFLDEAASTGKRWKVIEESFFQWQSKGSKQVLGINANLNNKYKRTKDKEDSKTLIGQFLNVLEESMSAYSPKRVSAAQQRQDARGVEKGTGVSEAKKNVPASERKYGYTVSDRAYRTEYSGETKTIEEYESELIGVNNELSKSNAQLEQAKSNLEAVRQKRNESYKKGLDEAGLSQEQRQKLKDKYPNIKSQEDFGSAYEEAKKKYEDSKKKSNDLQSKIDAESKRIDDLDTQVQNNHDFITAAQKRINNVKKAGGVEQYINQLDQKIQKSKEYADTLAETNKRNKTELQILEYSFNKGEIDESTYNKQKNEIEAYIKENEKLVRSEQEKYRVLKQLRENFINSGVKNKDGNYLSVEEYEKNQKRDIQTVTTSSNKLLSERLSSTKSLESLQSEAQQTSNESSVAYAELYNLEVAFNEEYQKYVNQQLDITKKNLETTKLAQKEARANVANAQKAYNGKKTAIELEEGLISKATTEDDKKKHIETKKKLESEMADADKVLQEAKQKQDEIDRSVETLSNKVSALSIEVDNANSLRNPSISTEFDRELQEAQARYNIEDSNIKEIENKKSALEDKIRRLKEGRNIAEAPIDKMTQSQKETAVRKEVEAINEDFKIAEDRIEEAKDRKEKIDAELKYLSGGKNRISFGMRDRINANYAFAERDLANNSEYQKFVQELNQQIGLDRETKKAKRREWVADWIDKNDTTGKYKVSRESYVADLKAAQKAQEGLITAAKEYQGELTKHKQSALAILGVTEEELFAQKEITKEVQQQNSDTSSSTSTTTTTPVQESREIERRVEEQSSNVDQAFIDAIDARLDENDVKIRELQAQVNVGTSGVSTKTKEKFKKYGLDLNTHFVTSISDKHNKNFYNTLKQEKGTNLFDASDVENIDKIIKKARELRVELSNLEKDGKQRSTKSIMLQRQLSKLLDATKKRVSATSLSDGYEKNKANKNGYAQMSQDGWKKFLTDHGAGDLAGFVGSKLDISNDNKLYKVLLSTIDSSVSKYPEQFQQLAVKAYEDAFNAKKNSLKGSKLKSGEIERRAKEAGLKILEDYLMEFNYGFTTSIPEYDTSSENNEAKSKISAKIKEISTENEELRKLREHYIKGMLDEDDAGTLFEFFDKKTQEGMMYTAAEQARSSVDTTGKTKEQIEAEVRSLSEKIMTEMILSMVNSTREGIHDAGDNYNDISPIDDDNDSGSYGYYSGGNIEQIDGAVIQANKVVVNGNTIGTSGDGSGPWALETTLGKTNEILKSISSKIDSSKIGSDSDDESPIGSGDKKKKKPTIDVDTARNALYQAADDNLAKSFGEGTKSVRKFNEDTLKLYETLTLANGETVKFTYSINKMDGSVKSSYTTVANFESVAKKAYAELGKNQIATKQMLDGLNFPEEKITAYNNAVAALDNKLKNLGNKGVTDSNDAAEVEKLTGNVKKLRTELEGMYKSSYKLSNENSLVKSFGSEDIGDIKSQMKALAQEAHNGAITFNGFNEETNELTFSFKNNKNELTTLTYKFDELTNSVYRTGKASKTTTGFFKGFFSDVGAKIGQLARYYTGMSLLTEGIQQVRRGVQYVRDIDLALTELKKVTDESESSYNRFLQTMSNTASVVGSTVSELTNSAAAWARLGYSMEEAGELAKNTAILLNVSEFQSEEQATEALISSLQAFNYEAKDSIEIVDKLNIIGNNFAISSDGIAEGLSRSASTLVSAGNSLEESIALLAAGNKVQQDPEGLGNALKVLSMRIRGTKTDLEEAGEETEGMIENTSKLRDKVMALTNVDGKGGVDILTDTGAYKSTYQIMLEIAEVWDRLNEYDPKAQAALLEILAGKTRGSQVASILQNPEDLRDAYAMALDSDGSAQKELDTYLNSIQGRIDLFTNELQTFWKNLINSNVIKFIVDAGTTIFRVLNNIMDAIDSFADGWGSLGVIVPSILIGIATHIFKVKNEIKDMSGMLDFAGKGISNIFSSGKEMYAAYIAKFAEEMNVLSIASNGATGSLAGFANTGNMLKASMSALTATLGTTVTAILGVVAVMGVAALIYDAVTTSHKEYTKQIKESTEEIEDIRSEISSLNSELKTTNQRIDELENKGPLSFTEEEELARLKAQNDELERQIKLEEAREKREKQKQIDSALGAAKTDKNLQSSAVRTDSGTYSDIKGEGTTFSTGGNMWEQNLTALENAYQNLNEAEEKLWSAQESGMDTSSDEFKQLEKNVENAEKKVTSLESTMDDLENKEETGWQSIYGDIGYIENATTEKEKEWNEFYKQHEDYINKWHVLNGTFSKGEYLNDIFGTNATKEAKEFKQEIEKILEEDSEIKIQLDSASFDLSEARKELNEIKEEAKSVGYDGEQTKFGNIDLNDENRIVEWTEENLEKNKDAILSWEQETGESIDEAWERIKKEFEGSYSTVQGGYHTYDGIDIAYSPMLQTDNGLIQINQGTLDEYISALIAKAKANGQEPTYEVLMELDSQGLEGFEQNGYQIKNILADVGETAEKTSEQMHFAGVNGAIASAEDQVNSLQKAYESLLDNIGSKLQGFIDKHEWLKKLLESTGIDAGDLVGFFTQTGDYSEDQEEKITTTVTSLDKLTASVEAYKTTLQTVNNITHDGQAISEDYYNTLKDQLKDVTVAEQDFSDAIEEQNGKYIVKNISLLNKLAARSKNAQKATIQMAKAQAQLQYKNLVQQMRNTIIYMGAQAGAYGIMSQAVEENIWMMEDQLATLKQTIQQYALLELSLSKAGNAFDEYEKAKERDAQLTYDDSMLEMLKTIDEGLLKNETGTEAFEYAVKAIVPEKFWKDIDDVDEKIKSIHDYIDGDNTFSRFFYVDEESGDLDITTDNVREFVDLCTESGLFDGNSKDFALSDSVEGIEDFAEGLGVTEAVALAMLTALEKVDAKWGNILTEVTMTSFDRKVYSTMQTMAELNSKFADGSITAEEYAKQMAEAEKNLDTYTQTAKTRLLGSDNGTPDDTSDDTVGFIEKNKQVVAAQEKVNKATDELVKKQKEYNQAVEDGVKGEDLKPYEDAVNEATVKVNEHTAAWSKLVEERGKYPTEYEIELVIADIDKEIEASGNKFEQAIKDNFHLDDDGYYIINTDANLDNLEKKYPGIKKYISLLNSKTEIQAFADTSSAEEDVNKFQSTVDGIIEAIENNLITLDLDEEAVNNIVEQANKILSGIASTLGVSIVANMPSWMKSILKFMGFNVDDGEKTPIVSDASKAPSSAAISSSRDNSAYYSKYKRGNSVFAKGSDGLKTSEHNAVVGELGPEMVVDPIRGVYYTVGENGTEMVDLPKGAIIYNHKQTEELMKKGYTSRGNYTGGLSFANGNAYSGLSHGIPSYHPNLEDKTSFANYTKVNTKWDDATSTLLDAADALSDASSDASDAFEDAINWIDVLFTRIENNISEQEAYLETIVDSTGGISLKDSVYSSIFGQLYSKANASIASRDYYAAKAEAEMAGLPADIQNKIRNGAVSIQDFKGTGNEESDEALQEYVDQINKAIEYYDKISEYEQQYWTTLTEIADKAVQRQEDAANAYENEIGLVEHLNSTLEAHNDLLETKEGFATEAYYKAQINANKTILSQYKAERKALQGILDEEVRLGHVKVGDQQWFDMQQAIYDVDDAIIDTEASIEDLQNSINDLHWARFDELINRFEYLEEEIGNVVQLLSHDSDGLIMEELRDLTTTNWATDSGLATIGLYAQEMERAQYVANEYAEAIKDLKKDYAAGKYNETEYLNKLNELISAQYENIEKYYDAKDAIVELNEARVDAIRNGIEKEIDAYNELIQKKKELLDKEQAEHDFKNEIEEKEKDVADLRKQLAAMDGDTTAATTAKKKQLEAELLEAQKALEESYYSHSMTSRQEALDKEFSDFEEEKNKEIEKWEEWLLNTETVVSEALEYVKTNTSEVYATLTELGNQYGLTMSDTLTTPWQSGQMAIDSYSTTFEDASSVFTSLLDEIALHWENVTAKAEAAARAQANALQAEYKATTSNVPSTINTNSNNNNNKPANNTPKQTTQQQNNKPTQKAITVGGKINAGSARIYATSSGTGGGKQYYASDPIYTVLQEQNGYLLVRHHKLKSGYTGWFKKSDVKAYAKGTNKIGKDQLALLNELGPELQLAAGSRGNLEYVKYGTSIIPSDVSEKLINLALDPASIFDDMKTDVKAPTIETKDFNYEFNFDSLLHVDNASNDSIPALQKMIRSEFNNMMSQVNNKIKRSGKS